MSEKKLCKVEGCSGTVSRIGFCGSHYWRQKKYGDPLAGGAPKTKVPEKCGVDGCVAKPSARGYCHNHYLLFMKYGDPNKAKFKRGQGKRNEWHPSPSTGYIWRYAGRDYPGAGQNGFIYEHREVMRLKLGRELLPGENVHHINGVKTDNRPENLELWVTSQPVGQRPEDLVVWAKEILRRYDK